MIHLLPLKCRILVLAIIAMLATPALAFAQTKLVLQAAFPAPSMSLIVFYIAEQAGFFKEEGLDVELRFSSGGPQAIQIAANGGADLALVSVEPIIQGHEKGVRGKAFYRYYARMVFYVAIPADGPVKTVKDLAGKKIGVSNMASSAVVTTTSMLKNAGVAVTNDMFLPVGLGDSALAALRSKQVQALSLWDSAYAGMLRTGIVFNYLYHPTMADLGNGTLFAPNNTINEKSALFAGLARAFAKATAFYEENPEAALQIYWKGNPAARPADDKGRAVGLTEVKYMLGTFSVANKTDKRYGVMEMTKLQQYIDLYREEGLISGPLKAEEIATNALIDQVNDFDIAKVRALALGWK